MPGPVRQDFVFKRGDPWILRTPSDGPIVFSDGRTLLTTGALVWSTVKRLTEQLDAAALSQVNSGPLGGVQRVEAQHLIVRHPFARTQLALPGVYHYDIACDFSRRESWPLFYGLVHVTVDQSR